MSSHFELKVLFLDDQDTLVTGNDELMYMIVKIKGIIKRSIVI
jgi:hypothetical protein